MRQGPSSPRFRPPPDPNRVWFQVHLSRDLYEGLQRVAAANYRTMSSEIRLLIEARAAEFDAEQERAA